MSDRDIEDAVAAVLSRLVGEYGTKDGNDLMEAARTLRMYDGTHPNGAGVMNTEIGMRRRGLTRRQLRDAWEELRLDDHESASFPRELLADLVDPATWPLLQTLIEDGPRIASRRMEASLHRYSKVQVRPNVARPKGGRVTLRSIDAKRRAYRRIMRIIVELRSLEYPCAALDPWAAIPPLRIPDVVPERTDRSAPPLDLVRAVLHRLDGEIDRRLGAVDGDKLAAIEAMRIAPLLHTGVFLMSRHLVIIALLATLGCRISPLARVVEADYDPCHRFPDGEIGPALRLYPGKVVHEDLARWKGLAPKEAALIEAHLALTRRLYREREPTSNGSWRVLRHPRPMPEGRALLAADLFDPLRPPSPEAMSNMLAGSSGGYARLPLPEYLDAPARGRNGHSSHRVRHLGEQLVRAGIENYCLDKGIRHVRSAAVADAALDRAVRDDRYGYADLASEQGRERWSRRAAHAASRLLWTDAGARRVPDLDAYEQAQRSRRTLAAEVDGFDRQRAAARRPAAMGADAALAALREVVFLADQAERARRELDAATEECRRLERPASWRALPAGSPRHPAEGDAEAALHNVRKRVESEHEPERLRLVPRRHFLTVPELAAVLQISEATARRLVSRHHARTRIEWPFWAEVPPVDSSLGCRRRRVWAGGLITSKLDRHARAHLERVLAKAPTGWKTADVDAPLELPAPYADALAADSGLEEDHDRPSIRQVTDVSA